MTLKPPRTIEAAASPYTNCIVAAVKQTVKRATAAVRDERELILKVGGVSYRYDLTKEAQEYMRHCPPAKYATSVARRGLKVKLTLTRAVVPNGDVK